MKTVVLALTILLSISVYAQNDDVRPTDKGSFLVNGAFNFNTSNVDATNSFLDGAKQFNLSFSPRAGYFVMDGLAVGLETTFTYAREEFEFIYGTLTNKTSIFTAGPFVRYYLKSGFFAEASIGFGKQNSESDDPDGVNFETEIDFFSYELGVGYAIFFNNNVSLEPFLSYQFDQQTQNEDEIKASGLNLGVGFTFYFR